MVGIGRLWGVQMVARLLSIVVFILISSASALPAKANWLATFGQAVVRDIKRRHCWPRPFVCPDRHAVRAPMAVMVANGWRRQNMLGDYHFDAATGKLTDAGKMKVRWIVTEAPQHHRTIFVHRALTAEATAGRIGSVQEFAAATVPQGEGLPAVLPTSISARGWPAERVDAIGRKFHSSIPEPRLPAPTEESGGN